MLGIILRKALNMFNPEEVMPEIRFALCNRYTPLLRYLFNVFFGLQHRHLRGT